MIKEKMHPIIKNKWVTALKSGDYKLGAGELYDPKNNTWCVFGVLTDIYRKEHNLTVSIESLSFQNINPNEKVLNWAGIFTERWDFKVSNNSREFCLQELSDCLTTEELADIIQNQY
jgi:hypothetical protein